MPGRTRSRRHRLYLQQDGICFYCRVPMTLHPGAAYAAQRRVTIDHLPPRSQGGQAVKENEVGACFACNNARGCTDWRDFLRRMAPRGGPEG